MSIKIMITNMSKHYDFLIKAHFFLAWLSSQNVPTAVVKYSHTSLHTNLPAFSQPCLRHGSWLSCVQILFKWFQMLLHMGLDGLSLCHRDLGQTLNQVRPMGKDGVRERYGTLQLTCMLDVHVGTCFRQEKENG